MESKRDYLKYLHPVKRYILKKYEISNSDLSMLLFLNSEGYFTSTKFNEFASILHWDRARFDRMRNAGFIDTFSHRTRTTKARYCLSPRAKRMIHDFYDYLEGKEIPETTTQFTKKKVGYNDKVHRHFIKQLNASIRRQQRHAPE